MERPPRTPQQRESPFYKGGLVRLRADLGEDVLEALEGRLAKGETYKIFHIDEDDDASGSPAAWIGPMNASPADVEAFNPLVIFNTPGSTYAEVFPVALSHLESVRH